MISISVDIDQAATQRLERLFLRFEREMPERIAGATRRAGIYVLNSLKARTIKAPKKMRSGEYSLKAIKGGYVTRMDDVIHLWEFVHLPGTTDAKRKVYGAYATRERSKATKWKWRGLKAAEERREIVNARDLLKIRRAGLAKLSWGWIAKQVLGLLHHRVVVAQILHVGIEMGASDEIGAYAGNCQQKNDGDQRLLAIEGVIKE